MTAGTAGTATFGDVRLTDGGLLNRIKCQSCGRMVPMYVDRGDGQVLRRHPYMPGDPRSSTPDPALDTGFCVMATDVLPACPACGAESHGLGSEWGRNAKITGTFGAGPCGPDCHEATGEKCRCSCGGASHGVM